MSEREKHQPDQPVPVTKQQESSSPVITRRNFIAGAAVAALGATGFIAVAVKRTHDRRETEAAYGEKMSQAIDEYRTALRACLAHPSQETAETLNRKSMVANLFYSALQPDLLSPKNNLNLGVAVADLNEQAIEAIEAITPQTRYTQHYLHSIRVRDVVWKLRAIGDDDGAKKVWEDELERAREFSNMFSAMATEQQKKYMSQPVEIEKSAVP